jgi:hypothetical protein
MPLPLRQQPPMNHGPRSRMMHSPMYYGNVPHRQYNQPFQMQPPGMNRNQGNRGPGLLAKILGRGKQQDGFTGALPSMTRGAAGSSGGILQSLTNPETINGFLNNTQAVLRAAQQFGPVIQQYGPIIKNIPSLWKLYRGLKEATNDSEGSSDVEQSVTDESIEEINVEPIEEKEQIKGNLTSSRRSTERIGNRDNRSVPKLYI